MGLLFSDFQWFIRVFIKVFIICSEIPEISEISEIPEIPEIYETLPVL